MTSIQPETEADDQHFMIGQMKGAVMAIRGGHAEMTRTADLIEEWIEALESYDCGEDGGAG